MKSTIRLCAQLVCAAACFAQLPSWAQSRHLPSDDRSVLSVGGQINQSANAEFQLSSATPTNQAANSKVGMSLGTLESLPQHQFTTMTPWSDKPIHFSGPLLRDVLAMVGAEGHTIRATAINDYRIQIPKEDALRYNVIVATRMNGERMSIRDKGPLFVVYPFDSDSALKQAQYYERSIWQLKSLEVE